MADPIKRDDPFDNELRVQCNHLDALKRELIVFSNTSHSLPPKERARLVVQIQNKLKSLTRFLDKNSGEVPINAGTKFRLENFKSGLASIKTQWKKIESKDETSSSSKPIINKEVFQGDDLIDRAARDYSNLLSTMGSQDSETLTLKFKNNLSQALQDAKAKTGHQNFDISISQESNKIKVKITPKT